MGGKGGGGGGGPFTEWKLWPLSDGKRISGINTLACLTAGDARDFETRFKLVHYFHPHIKGNRFTYIKLELILIKKSLLKPRVYIFFSVNVLQREVNYLFRIKQFVWNETKDIVIV